MIGLQTGHDRRLRAIADSIRPTQRCGFSNWVGDCLQDKQSNPKSGDVVGDWSYSNDRRAVSTIRLAMPIRGTKSEVVAAARRAYGHWCRRNHRLPLG